MSRPLDGFEEVTADLRSVLTGWRPEDPEQEALRRAYLDHLGRHPDAAAKSGPPQHFTASCVVLSPDGERVLLTLHRKARRWLQLGGHLDAGDPSLLAAARREVLEESGLPATAVRMHPGLLQLDRHDIRSGFTCTEHLDLRFGAVADTLHAPVVSAESLDLAWWPVEALPADLEEAVTDLITRTREAWVPTG